MGMGFTPRLAQADELPGNPFVPGPCVTQPGTPAGESSQEPSSETATPSHAGASSGSASSSPEQKRDKPRHKPTAEPTPAPSASSSPTAPAKQGGKADRGETAAPSPTAGSGLLGSILGGLQGLLTGGKHDGGAATGGAPSSTPAPTPKPAQTSQEAADPAGTADPGGTTPGPSASGPSASEPAATSKDRSASPGSAPSASGSSSSSSGDKRPYPCPTPTDAAGKLEPAPNLLPDEPWTLKSSLLGLHGLRYHGIVRVRTANGTVKKALKFTATGVDIGDLHQLVDGGDGKTTYHVQAREGSTSTIRNGTVTMYTEKLQGNLFGVVPITFTPRIPPPLTLPETAFTNVTVIQAGQFGGTLTIPGMHLYTT